jgi:hypothetical protein
MSTRIGISFGLALTLVLGIVVTMLALGVLTPSKVAGQEATAVTEASVVATPNEPGAAARYVVTFTTDTVLEINDVIVLEFENEYQVPTTLEPSAISISGEGSGVESQTFSAHPSDVTVRSVGSPANQHQITLTIPDMNPSDEKSEGIAGGVVRVTFAQNSGMKNPLESANRTVKITTSYDSFINCGSTPRIACPREYFPRILKISSSDGGRGKVLTVTGFGYISGTTATIWLDRNENGAMDSGELKLGEAPVGNDMTFTATVTVNNPPFTPGKGDLGSSPPDRNALNAIDGRANSISPTVAGYSDSANTQNEGNCIAQGGRLSCPPVFELRGSVSVSPSSAAVGDTIQVTLKDFDPVAFITESNIDIGGVPVNPFSATTTSQGDATINVVVPNGVPTGRQQLNAKNICCTGSPGGNNSTRRFTMTIASAVLTLTPSSDLVPNKTITVVGRGFTTGGNATINNTDDSSQVAISGNTNGLKGTGGARQSKINEGKTISIDNGGNWASSMVMPINNTTTTPGTHELKVTDNAGREGTVSFTIAARTLTLEPQDGRVGTRVQVTGSGYPADNTKGIATPPVTITYVVAGAPRTVTTLNPDSSGNIRGSFIVPLDAGIPSTNSVRAVYRYPTPVTTATTHSVPRAVITVEPDSGPIGTRITITGVGFKTFSSLTELNLGDIDVRPAPIPSTDNVGDFSTTIRVPQLNTGTQSVTAKVGGDQGTTASATFEVLESGAVTPTPQAGAPPADVFAPIGDALVRAFVWNKGTKSWDLYDPRPAFAAISVDMVAPGNIVQILVNNDAQFQGETLTPDWNVLTLQ